MIVRIIAGKLLWILYEKVSNLFSNYVELPVPVAARSTAARLM
jgi:hypothetical protein